jgi:hypothetical protein
VNAAAPAAGTHAVRLRAVCFTRRGTERLLTAAEKQRKSRFQHGSDRFVANNTAPNQWVGREIRYLADQRNFFAEQRIFDGLTME